MRTKALLGVAAALAVGAVSAQAQVYSVNIVGYVNQIMPAGSQVAVANPLDNGTNDLNSVFGSLAKNSLANFWDGSGFVTSQKFGSGWSPNSPTPVGTGLFISSINPITNTYVGEVIAGPGESITNSLPPGAQVLVGSALPYAGTLNSTNLGLLALDKNSLINTWDVGSQGFVTSQKFGSGWSPNTAISVAEGFFINSISAKDWVQTAPSN